MGKAVRAACHERLEGVLRVQRRAVARRDDVHVAVIDRGGRLVLEEASLIGVFFLAAAAVTGGRLFFSSCFLLGWLHFRLCFGHDLEAHLVLAAQYGADRVLDDREVVAGDPVLDEVVLDAQDKSVVGQGERLDRLEPLEG